MLSPGLISLISCGRPRSPVVLAGGPRHDAREAMRRRRACGAVRWSAACSQAGQWQGLNPKQLRVKREPGCSLLWPVVRAASFVSAAAAGEPNTRQSATRMTRRCSDGSLHRCLAWSGFCSARRPATGGSSLARPARPGSPEHARSCKTSRRCRRVSLTLARHTLRARGALCAPCGSQRDKDDSRPLLHRGRSPVRRVRGGP